MGLLTREQRNRLVELLVMIPNVHDPVARNSLVVHLPDELRLSIPISAAPRVHIQSIVDTVEETRWTPLVDDAWPIILVVESALFLMKGTHNHAELERLLDTLKQC